MALLSKILPHFVAELASAMHHAGHAELASVARNLEVFERCRCRELGCVTFFAVPRARCPPAAKCIRIVPDMRGVSSVYLHEGRIVYVEAFGRMDDRRTLDRHFPTKQKPAFTAG